MIDDSVIAVFKAALTDLIAGDQRATGFELTIIQGNAKGKVGMFLVKDDVVIQILLDYFDHLGRDHGGRKPHKVEVRREALPDDN